MQWTFSIKNKMGASIILLTLCLLVLLSNYLDRLHTENVKKSIATMYADRLIVEDYILQMTRNVYQIREIQKSDAGDTQKESAVGILTKDFKTIFYKFSKTKLTKTEKTVAVELFNNLKEFEQIALEDVDVLVKHTNRLLSSLHKLSAIQLEESGLIMKQVESQYATIKASSQFAFAIVIIILIVLQLMVFSGESLIPLFKPKDPSLN